MQQTLKKHCHECEKLLPLDAYPELKSGYLSPLCSTCLKSRAIDAYFSYRIKQPKQGRKKLCPKCFYLLPLSAFYGGNNGNPSAYCKPCSLEWAAIKRAADRAVRLIGPKELKKNPTHYTPSKQRLRQFETEGNVALQTILARLLKENTP